MRVVGGLLGGRRLFAPKGEDVRPTPDRVREPLFSILGGSIEGATLDLFSGTGAIGIEAVSRGASQAVLVEKDRRALEVIEKNVQTLELSDQIEIFRGDVERVLPTLLARALRFELIFADPPYRLAEALFPPLLIALRPLLVPSGRIVLEHASRTQAPEANHPLRRDKTKRYGETTLSFYSLSSEPL